MLSEYEASVLAKCCLNIRNWSCGIAPPINRPGFSSILLGVLAPLIIITITIIWLPETLSESSNDATVVTISHAFRTATPPPADTVTSHHALLGKDGERRQTVPPWPCIGYVEFDWGAANGVACFDSGPAAVIVDLAAANAGN